MTRRWNLACVLALCVAGCAPRLAVGAACDGNSACSEPLVCRLGRCRSECVSQRDCPLGALCLLDQERNGSCRLPEETLCTSSDGCAAGLTCIDGECANACVVVADCPTDSRCEAGHDGLARCVRDDLTIPDSGPSDAGPADAMDAPACPGPGCERIIDVAVNERASCALRANGAVYCWGLASTTGTSGGSDSCTATEDCSTSPRPVLLENTTQNLTGVTAIAANATVTCAVSRGRTVCWGDAYTPLGSTGDGSVARSVRSGSVTLPANATRVAVADVAAFSDSEGGYLWGDGRLGEFGLPMDMIPEANNTEALAGNPLPLGEQVFFGTSHGCGLVGGRVHCWGENDYGQSAALSVGPIIYTSAPVGGLPSGTFIDVAPGRAHTCALSEDGAIWCWGDSELFPPASRTGCAAIETSRFACPPARIFNPDGVTFTSLARTHGAVACAIDSEGGLWCWGTYSYIPNDISGANDPRRIELPAPVTRVAMGAYHACAVAGGEVYCWGQNELGQLGQGTSSEPGTVQYTPTIVAVP